MDLSRLFLPLGGFCFQSEQDAKPLKSAAAPKAKRARAKIDPKYHKATRELRDRYLERLNESPKAMIAPSGKYDVSRSLVSPDAPRALPDAA